MPYGTTHGRFPVGGGKVKYTNDLYVILMIGLVDYLYHLDTMEF
jgi:hypothetical protein